MGNFTSRGIVILISDFFDEQGSGTGRGNVAFGRARFCLAAAGAQCRWPTAAGELILRTTFVLRRSTTKKRSGLDILQNFASAAVGRCSSALRDAPGKHKIVRSRTQHYFIRFNLLIERNRKLEHNFARRANFHEFFTDLFGSVKEFMGTFTSRGIVILISDFFDEQGSERAVEMLRSAGQ